MLRVVVMVVLVPTGDDVPPRIAIVRALPGLGDFLCAVPAWRALRRALPLARITLVALPQWRPLVRRFGHYVNEHFDFPGYPGIPERDFDRARLTAFLRSVRGRFDFAWQMHGSGAVMNRFTRMLAHSTAGHYPPEGECPDPQRYRPFDDDEPEVRRHLRVLQRLGIPAQGEELEFPVRADEQRTADELIEAARLPPGEFVALHAGASSPEKRWPTVRFAEVAERLVAGGRPVLLTGSADEVELSQGIVERVSRPVADLTGRTALGVLAAVLRRGRLLVCNDTGVSHLAAALQIPSVVIFSTGNPRRWAPLNCNRHRTLFSEGGSRAISTEEVWREVEVLLESGEFP